MKKLALLSILVLAFFTLSGQKTDVLIMKNGSVLRGSIEELIPGQTVRILDRCGNSMVYNLTEIEKISSEENTTEVNGYEYKSYGSGIVNITTIGVLAGSIDNDQPAPFSIQSSIGYRNDMGIFMGGGTGVEFVSSTFIPLFLDLRYDLYKRPITPYVAFKGGYALPMQKNVERYNTSYLYEGGPMAAIGLGLKIRNRAGIAWDISMLYRYQQISYTYIYDYQSVSYQYSERYNRIELRLGFYID